MDGRKEERKGGRECRRVGGKRKTYLLSTYSIPD